jgi:hypothetical protein
MTHLTIARWLRAAIEGAPYDRPKLAVAAVSSPSGNDFAAMPNAVARSNYPQVEQIELKEPSDVQ